MKIEICPVFNAMPNDRYYGKTVVVVHALRSVSSMIWAMKNGAEKIVPVVDAGAAVEMALRISDPNCLQAGEQNGEIPQGFSLGNSPASYTPEIVRGKTIILSTSNGTQAINATGSAKNILLGAMINRTAVAKEILKLNTDTVIMCVGSDGEPATEDLLCAGAVVNALLNIAAKSNTNNVIESDMAFVCRTLYKDFRNTTLDITSARAVKELLQRGCKADIEFCLSPDLTDIVPRYENGIVIL